MLRRNEGATLVSNLTTGCRQLQTQWSNLAMVPAGTGIRPFSVI